jgi:hypothetical protein
LGGGNGFVWYFFAKGLEALELLDGAAVVALGLGLVAQQQGPTVGLAGHAVEACAEEVVRVSSGIRGLAEAGGEKAGFEARGAEDGLLGEGDALKGKKFLGVDGVVDLDEVGLEVGDGLEVFRGPRGHPSGGGSRGEAVLAGVEGGAGLTLGRARASRFGGVGSVGGELPGGDDVRHKCECPSD